MDENVFFYGLFMDQTVLADYGVKPLNDRDAFLPNYKLVIGSRANVVPSRNDNIYGRLMTIHRQELNLLYQHNNMSDYNPIEVVVIDNNNEEVKASCYIIAGRMEAEINVEYASKLFHLARELDFPQTYLDKIQILARSR